MALCGAGAIRRVSPASLASLSVQNPAAFLGSLPPGPGKPHFSLSRGSLLWQPRSSVHCSLLGAAPVV